MHLFGFSHLQVSSPDCLMTISTQWFSIAGQRPCRSCRPLFFTVSNPSSFIQQVKNSLAPWGTPASNTKMLVVTPVPWNTSSGSLITLRRRWLSLMRLVMPRVFSSFLSGRMNAHMVPCGTLSNTFSTMFMQPNFVSNGGFISTLVMPFDLIHAPASGVRESRHSRFVLPSLWMSMFAQAKAYTYL